jgi:hypothetical protein
MVMTICIIAPHVVLGMIYLLRWHMPGSTETPHAEDSHHVQLQVSRTTQTRCDVPKRKILSRGTFLIHRGSTVSRAVE